MRQFISILIYLFCFSFISCEKEDKIAEAYVDLPTDILFEEFNVGRFQHQIPNAPFKSKIATFNVVRSGADWGGFAISNRNYRLYAPDETKIDTTRFSVYTSIIHAGGNFLVAKTDGDHAFVSFDRAVQLDRVLVANTTQVWQTISYGQGTTTVGLTHSPGTRALSIARNDYAKVIATGYLDNQETGKVEFLLADRRSDELLRNFTVTDWLPMELSALGKIDKILFQFDTSDKTLTGELNTPPYFCLDGFRFNENL